MPITTLNHNCNALHHIAKAESMMLDGREGNNLKRLRATYNFDDPSDLEILEMPVKIQVLRELHLAQKTISCMVLGDLWGEDVF